MTDLAVHRGDFMAARNCIWFNNGVVCLTPQPVDDEYRARLDETSRRGPLHVSFPEEEYPRRQSSRDRIAEFLGARSRDVAFVRGVSEAYITVLRGIEWGPNDELIISTDEEAALLLPSLHLRDDQNVRVIRLPVDLEPDAFVGEFVARATSRTRLVALSQVTTNLGCRLPVRELCAAARERGVLTFVDTAHSAGLLDVQLEQLGCDFAGALSYKWMYGPYAAGLLWCQPALATRLRLAYAGNRSQEAVDEERMTYSLKRTAQRFEYGPWTWPVIHAWAAATKYVDVIGRRAIWDRTVTLASSLKDELNRIE
ncbi:MAG TPA: aminotransferase class V-fold PLP-dependent enzyme, partial [Blastocatellia bacterium]|nr:aminotransferase class V-fold PLP-dependent enzyme [Blastocatellia bacterium]